LMDSGFEAVFIAVGAGAPMFLNIPGENLIGVFSANELLTRVNLMKAYRKDYDTPVIVGQNVAVVGAGNVAMDAARTSLRLGAKKVTIVYRRSAAEIPARAEEVENAKEEGIVFKLLTNPVRILGDDKNHVIGMECIRMELGEPDASGRRRPVHWRGLNSGLPPRRGAPTAAVPVPGGEFAYLTLLMLKPWGPMFNWTPCCTAYKLMMTPLWFCIFRPATPPARVTPAPTAA